MQKAESLSLNKTQKNIRVGVGLRHSHFPEIETRQSFDVDFFEIITENFLHTKGRPWRILEHVRESHPIAMHGVSLSVASVDPLDLEYVKKVSDMAKIIDPIIISDHLCWTGGNAHNLHNLLPFPYTFEALEHVANRVEQVQEILGRTLALENLSAYMSYKDNEMDEIEFMNRLCDKTGCGILFDLNNLFVNASNLKFDASKMLDRVNLKHVRQFHLAGYSDFGTHLFDTHSKEVQPPVWELLKQIASKITDQPILVEWDEDIPEFDRVVAEANSAKKIILEAR